MAALLAMILSGVSFLPLLGDHPARPAVVARPAPNRELSLSPGERDLVRKGKIILRELASPGRNGRTYEAVGLIPGSLEEAASILTDFERYPDFMPNVSAVRICERGDPCSIIEITLRLPLGMKKQYRLRYTATRGDAAFELGWEQLAWPELKPSHRIADTSGYWLVRGSEDGGLLVVYHVYTDPGRVPLGLTGVARGLAKNKITDGIAKLRERVRRVFRPGVK
jgi:hypothetical protein